MTAWLKLIATLLVLSGSLVEVMGRVDAAHAFMPAGVTTVLDESPIDEEATQALPQAWVAYGWSRHDDGHCSYKGYRARDCPDKEVDFWETLIPNPHSCPPPIPCPPNVETCVELGQPCLKVEATSLCAPLVVPCCDGYRCEYMPTPAPRGPFAPALQTTAVATTPPSQPSTTPAPTTAAPTPPPSCGNERRSMWRHVTNLVGANRSGPMAQFEVGQCVPDPGNETETDDI